MTALDAMQASLGELAPTDCAHCGAALGPGSVDAYCCAGCRAVAAMLEESGLDRYYDLRDGKGTPVPLVDPTRRDLAWLAPLEERVRASGGACHLQLDVQGMHCAGCVWVFGEIFKREDDAVQVVANPSLGRVELWVGPNFDLGRYVRSIERFGYMFGPALKGRARREDALLVRTGIAVALAANAMMFAVAIYLGLREGPLFEMMSTLEIVFAAGAVAVGLPVFGRAALEGLRRGVLHLDLPIALGMVLALAGSIWAHFAGATASYGDTVAVFVALMLLGRWIQERVVASNRDRLLASEGSDGLFTRRVQDGRMEMVRCSAISRGDLLLIAPGELVPVDARVEAAEGSPESSGASVSLDWISGESAPRDIEAGGVIPAGAFSAGTRSIAVRAESDFADSPLIALLGSAAPESDARPTTAWWDRVARVYVVAVLGIAGAALAGWWFFTGDLVRALEVTTAVLVVTCPCGIGIATPLGYEIVGAAMRGLGLYVRRERLLDRAPAVGRVVFDKTGTLTTGVPELADRRALEALDPEARAALADLVARSAHPKSLAVRRALGASVDVRDGVEVEEHPGRGLSVAIDGVEWRLGREGWAGARSAADERSAGDLVLARDGAVAARFEVREVIRPDAREEIAALDAEGYETWILSGDAPERVAAMARDLGIDPARAIGGCSPEQKREWIAAHDRGDTLFVGDGINDGPAAELSFASGTPAVDRPFLPSRADFWFVTPGLGPIRAMLHAARRLRWVAHRNLGLAIGYNVVAVALCVAGLMQPWLAAVLMPASSLFVIGATALSLRGSSLTRAADIAQPART